MIFYSFGKASNEIDDQSNCKAEYQAIISATSEHLLLKILFLELKFKRKITHKLPSDNQVALYCFKPSI